MCFIFFFLICFIVRVFPSFRLFFGFCFDYTRRNGKRDVVQTDTTRRRQQQRQQQQELSWNLCWLFLRGLPCYNNVKTFSNHISRHRSQSETDVFLLITYYITITRLCWYYTTVQDNTCLLLRVCKTLSLLNLMCNANDIVCFCCMLTGLTSLLYYTYTTGPYYKPCSTYSTGAVIIRVAAASFHSFTNVIYFVL